MTTRLTTEPQSEIHLRTIGIEDWQLWRKLRLEALAEAPYAFASKLADWQGEGDTESRWRGRLTDVPLNIIAEWRGTAVGMISATAPSPQGSVELLSMWVAPPARRRGIGDALVDAVLAWAHKRKAATVVLAVFEGNEPATVLYGRQGFKDVGAIGDGTGVATERRMLRPV